MKTREAVPLVDVVSNEVIQQKPYTCVVLRWRAKEILGEYTSYGFARCNWRDRWNKDLGIKIARNRAIFNAAAAIVSDSSSMGSQAQKGVNHR